MPTSSWSQDGCQDADLASLEGRKIFVRSFVYIFFSGWAAPHVILSSLYREQIHVLTAELTTGEVGKGVP